MKKIKIYLDVCCYNRPFDDQTKDNIHLEAEAIIQILNRAQNNYYELIGSEVIDYEINQIINFEKKDKVLQLSLNYKKYIKIEETEIIRASELEKFGFNSYDSLHLSCAESAKADVFLTTDYKLIKIAEKQRNKLKTTVANPIFWVMGDIIR